MYCLYQKFNNRNFFIFHVSRSFLYPSKTEEKTWFANGFISNRANTYDSYLHNPTKKLFANLLQQYFNKLKVWQATHTWTCRKVFQTLSYHPHLFCVKILRWYLKQLWDKCIIPIVTCFYFVKEHQKEKYSSLLLFLIYINLHIFMNII